MTWFFIFPTEPSATGADEATPAVAGPGTGRESILSGAYTGPVFEQQKWEDGSDMTICA